MNETIPVGLCQCGCGERTPLAKSTDVRKGLVKGQPLRYLPHHHKRGPNYASWTAPAAESGIPVGLCQCGCGLPTPLATQTRAAQRGLIKGQPLRYLPGHQRRRPDAPSWTTSAPQDSIPVGLCQCGCGQRAPIAQRTDRRKGVRKGEPYRYIAGHQPGLRGENHPNWKGGRTRHHQGYILVRAPWHPHAADGCVMEHRLVVEAHWGPYFLEPDEEVHHKNGVKDDNHWENLQVLPSKGAHSRLHAQQWRQSGRWARKYERCVACETTEHPHNARGLCTKCYHRYARPRLSRAQP